MSGPADRPAADWTAGDWTAGEPTLAFDECRACGQRWSIPRTACPECGTPGPARRPSSGVGRVVAVSVVHPLSACSSGPFGEPYTLALVDLDDGIRAMGRGDPGLTVGASVRVKFPDGIPRWAPCP